MPADFLDAHDRHWEDGEMLFEKEHWPNADHLYGVSAECGLKWLMRLFGMPCDPVSGDPRDKSDRVHADGVWDRYESYRCGRVEGVGYPLPAQNPFDDWSVSQRYEHRDHFGKGVAERHRRGALNVRRLVGAARRDGLRS
jgi:hypothetical protein